ncbi:transglycosylase family protein [Nocardioides sp. AE5]|uniref:transglycosylase family protein n=1 Tax=Nocardioides sp. AE5 TaxID=2962573 RepID=UPI0028827794|nr:transglycosylase family protein [Nocardioides sp. AE5]MDT0203756.1 transglycosylase family protein [Nocardioides sp. AE5]
MRNSIALLTKSRAVLVALVAAVALALVGTTYGYAQLGNEITLSLDGETKTIKSSGDTVADVLADEDIQVGEHDIVAPGLDEEVTDGTRISVRFGRELTLTVDGETETHWVNSTTIEQALAEIGQGYRGADLSASRGATIERGGMTLEVTTPKDVTVTVGTNDTVERPVAGTTVADVLEKLGVTVGEDDLVSPKLTDEVTDGTKITVTRVTFKTESVTGETVKHGTTKKNDSSLYKGESRTEKAGVNGTRDVTYKREYRNGELHETTVVNAKVTKQPVDAVVRVGTKAKPAPKADYSGGDTVWDQLAKCESGGNWAINTGNGYYGGLQFSASTWRSVGGTGLPHQHSREEQIKRGKILQQRAGWGQWPACTRKLGLR